MIKNKNKPSKRFKNLQCKPGKELQFSCFTSKALHDIKTAWNIRHPDAAIESTDVKEIWEKIKDNMNNVCDKESCWYKELISKTSKHLLNYFAPEMPKKWKKKPREWLNSSDITNVMKQYEDTFPYFTFLGPSPIDFDKKLNGNVCVFDELCNFNLNTYLNSDNKKTKIGIIFNTDKHNEPGSHWVSLFINIKKMFIFFFDSTGTEPQPEIIKLIDRIKNQGTQIGLTFNVHINDIEHQKKNTECGIYSIFMISHLVQEIMSPLDFFNKRIPDDDVFQFRKIFFNEHEL